MSTSNHAAARLASAAGGIAAVLVVGEAANLASRTFGPVAGVAVIAAVFTACWLVRAARPLLHPQPQRPREPQLPAQAGNTPAESRDPDLIPVL